MGDEGNQNNLQHLLKPIHYGNDLKLDELFNNQRAFQQPWDTTSFHNVDYSWNILGEDDLLFQENFQYIFKKGLILVVLVL